MLLSVSIDNIKSLNKVVGVMINDYHRHLRGRLGIGTHLNLDLGFAAQNGIMLQLCGTAAS